MMSCKEGVKDFDATGTFESTEVIVSSENEGKILALNIEEGDMLKANQRVGIIDTTQLYLQMMQLSKNIKSVISNKPIVSTQIASIKDKISKQLIEKRRIENLLKGKAATTKQLDDVEANLNVLRSELSAHKSTLNNNISSIDAQSSAISIQIAQIADRLEKCKIKSPIEGIVLDKYMETGEFAVPNKPLFKVANMVNIYLRAYVTSQQLEKIKLGQKVKVFADFGGDTYKEYPGTISWISQTSEFTPKGIQTPKDRANLVYAIKVNVKNDGIIKLGMYGEVKF